MDDRQFWLTVRAALIMMVRAIEKRYGLNPVDLRLPPADRAMHVAVHEQSGRG